MCDVARRHGLASGQLFSWRRQLLQPVNAVSKQPFVPTLVEVSPAAVAVRTPGLAAKRARKYQTEPMVEVTIERCLSEDRERCLRGDDGGDPGRAEVDTVIGPARQSKVLIATRPVDFRKGMDGLAALVKSEHGAEPFSGVVYVFRVFRAKKGRPDQVGVVGRHGPMPVIQAARERPAQLACGP